MQARHCTTGDLQATLDIINREKYAGNIRFKGIETQGRQVRFTLTVNDSHGPGHRRGFPITKNVPGGRSSSFPGKHLAAACWHVHGHFFEALFRVNPKAEVLSGRFGTTGWITIHGGNWQDRNIGSTYCPLMFSEACDCEE